MPKNIIGLIACKLVSRYLIAFIVLLIPSLAISEVIQYTYDDMYRLVKVDYENGTVENKAYDALGNQLSKTITYVTPPNNAPYVPNSPNPADAGTQIFQSNIILGWISGDPDIGNNVTYDVYFGSSSPPPPLYISGLTSSSLAIPPLDSIVTYYWQVIAKDNFNAISEGPIWSFTTDNNAPFSPANPVPTDNSVVAYENVFLSWDSVDDPDEDDTVKYDIYFGETSSPSLVQSDISDPAIPGQVGNATIE